MLIILKKLCVTLFLSISFTMVCYGVDGNSISASSAVVIDGDTAEILYEKNPYQKRSMASTTKIMTTLLAVESDRLDDIVEVKEKPYIEGTAIGFNKGDKLTLKTLCYAMMLESGNDAALLTAAYLAGDEESFSNIMNKKAEEIGMKNTNFVTASGLDSEEHYTTAFDMALLGAYAVKNPVFREISSTINYKAEFISPDTVRYFTNHNRLLKSCDGVIGIKTGFTKKSGRCLVTACQRSGKMLVAVTLNAPDDWNDHKKLYDYAFSLYEPYTINADIPLHLTVAGSDKNLTAIGSQKTLTVLVLKNSIIKTKTCINKITYAPVRKYDILGRIYVYQNGFPVTELQIFSLEDISVKQNAVKYRPDLRERIRVFFKNLFTKGR